ncbi:MAG: hypothetical protein NTX65_05485 [Ignavibacteriales bacterium]|nr:hypothetical protein [Ignavibacteriales bacterium]
MSEQQKDKFLGFAKVKKYFPFVVLIVLSVALMFFFKHKKQEINKSIADVKNNLLSFYAENLKPLLSQTNISEEDIFNFALYNSLPLDKEKNKVLVISEDRPGNNTFVIKPADFNSSTKNYETFVNYMGMNESQKAKADSILNSYKKEIYSSVLVNEKNTYAVNPKIADIQQAVLADLISFAQKVNQSKSKELFTEHYDLSDKKKFADLITSAKAIPQNEYYLITPDTVARTYFKWNQEKFNQHLNDLEKSKYTIAPPIPNLDVQYESAPTVPKVKSIPGADDFSFNIDSNSFKIVVPMETMKFTREVNDSIRVKLRDAARKMKNISFYFGNKKHSTHSSRDSRIPNAPETPEIIINPYEIVNSTMEMLSKTQVKDWEKFGEKMDSLSRKFNPEMNDSLKKKITEEIMRVTKGLKKSNNKIKADTLKKH